MSFVEIRAVRAKEHTNDLLYNSKREDVIGVVERCLALCTGKDIHRLVRPVDESRAIPSSGLVVALVTEGIVTGTTLGNLPGDLV